MDRNCLALLVEPEAYLWISTHQTLKNNVLFPAMDYGHAPKIGNLIAIAIARDEAPLLPRTFLDFGRFRHGVLQLDLRRIAMMSFLEKVDDFFDWLLPLLGGIHGCSKPWPDPSHQSPPQEPS